MTQIEETTGQTDGRAMYLAGLISGMYAIERGIERAHGGRDWLLTSRDAPTLARSYAEGDADADDDSDEPRPSGPALDDPRGAVEPNDLDEDELRAVAASVYQEIDRVGADVSAWPEYASGRIRVADDLADEAHEPHALLATLRGLPSACGTDAMWDAVSRR